MTREYMTDDQRFASRRPDVLVYQTDVLAEDASEHEQRANLLRQTAQLEEARLGRREAAFEHLCAALSELPNDASRDSDLVRLGSELIGGARTPPL